MSDSRIIGRVTASERNPSTSTTVRFWVADGALTRPFDFVSIEHNVGHDRQQRTTSVAIVQELQYITDSAGHLSNYVSADFGDVLAEPFNRRVGTTVATAEVIFNSNDVEMPVRDGEPVAFASAALVKEALGANIDADNAVPAGYISMSNNEEIPVAFDTNFLIGPEGAHLNISGISGLATKTSYAMFLMNALQQRAKKPPSMIVFNVKGIDLLSIDRESAPPLGKEAKDEWRKCGLEAAPFEDVTFFYPFKRTEPKYTSSGVPLDLIESQKDAGQAFTYFYSLDSGLERLPILFTDIEDPTSSMNSIFDRLWSNKENFQTWDDVRLFVEERSTPKKTADSDISKASWRRVSRLLNLRLANDLFTEEHKTHAAAKRQMSAPAEKCRVLGIRAD